MELVKQISVFTSNAPGVLANICGFLRDEKISLNGISVVDHSDHALIRIIPSDPQRTLHLLGEAGLCAVENEILRIELSRGAGSLERILKAFSDSGLDILYLYGSEPANDRPVVYLNLSDNNKGLALFSRS